jgi:aerobic-type carbon monoxide dehydrogenase small subunit (CoxS/CutS family)
MRIDITVNETHRQWDVEPRETLLDALRREGFTGAKRVCESGECGACAVIVEGRAVDSCLLLAAQVGGQSITTVEGIEGDTALHPVQQAFAANGAVQCGFCIPGMVVTAANYLRENPNPTEDEIRHLFVGNLCRCTGYKKPVEAVLHAARELRGSNEN